MPQIGNNKSPVIFKNPKKGNRTLGLGAKFLDKENKEKYNEGWDRIFGKKKDSYEKK
tara:strand:- start:205 stop:375 length:171 start_codon:yes stop_codon:yes gene_type:complete